MVVITTSKNSSDKEYDYLLAGEYNYRTSLQLVVDAQVG